MQSQRCCYFAAQPIASKRFNFPGLKHYTIKVLSRMPYLEQVQRFPHLKLCQTRRIWIQVVDHALPGTWQCQSPDQQDGQHHIRENSCEIHHLKADRNHFVWQNEEIFCSILSFLLSFSRLYQHHFYSFVESFVFCFFCFHILTVETWSLHTVSSLLTPSLFPFFV